MLLDAQTWAKNKQTLNRSEIIEAFRVVWGANLEVREFSAITTGIVFTPEMLYIVAGRL
jgi:hypothetical protein